MREREKKRDKRKGKTPSGGSSAYRGAIFLGGGLYHLIFEEWEPFFLGNSPESGSFFSLGNSPGRSLRLPILHSLVLDHMGQARRAEIFGGIEIFLTGRA
ncbi:hypothetical protein VNO77_04045 [Canavalia gladiata]|uniref:Uncharacterized protein n=1 Tax=Canavalia gladiata TaxID=3824 RepID=A0AAN9MVY6_CANGL